MPVTGQTCTRPNCDLSAQSFKEANAFLQSRDGLTTPENSGSTRHSEISAIAETAAVAPSGPETEEKKHGERAVPAGSSTPSTPSAAGGGVGLPPAAVDSSAVCLVGATPSPAVDLDLLDQEVGVSMAATIWRYFASEESDLVRHLLCATSTSYSRRPLNSATLTPWNVPVSLFSLSLV